MFMIHDFHTDVQTSEISGVLNKAFIMPLFEDVADSLRTHLRYFVALGDPSSGVPLHAFSQPVEGLANMYRKDYKRPERNSTAGG
jgi:hypothetical protein